MVNAELGEFAMHRSPLDIVRLFLGLVQDLPAVSRQLYIPGAVLLLAYPVLAVLLGTGHQGEAFVTAFMLALAVRVALGFDALLQRMRARYSPGQTAVLALAFAVLPLIILAFAADPLSCQRLQSAFHLLVGSVFLSDVINRRTTTASGFWPEVAMRPYLPRLSRAMVLFNFTFLALNEGLIQWVAVSHWLLFWAVLPVMAQVVLQAIVQSAITLEDQRQPV